jgi:hypothetical protein
MSISLYDTNKGYTLNYAGKELNADIYFSTAMNKLGSEGWELVNVTPFTSSYAEDRVTGLSMTYTSKEVFYFKREIKDSSTIDELSSSKEYEVLKMLDQALDEIQDITKVPGEIGAEAIKEKYLKAGYTISFEHKDRLEFDNGLKKERFDRDKEHDKWLKRT